MKKTAMILGVVFLLGATTLYAADRDEVYERSGFVSGALAGAAVGGAPGAIIGAGIGGLFGHELERARDANDLDSQIAQLDTERVKLEGQLHGFLAERERLVADTRDLRQKQSQAIDSLEFDLYFKTGTSELELLASKRIREFAGNVTGNHTLAVHIDGFADQRGADPYNQTLSEARATAVRDALVSGGISPEKIAILGHGSSESLATDGDLDAYALERRVTVTVTDGSKIEGNMGQVADTGN